MSTPGNVGRLTRRVRRRLGVSQEGLARLLNATKGAVQHWERGRNRPDMARLLALRELCPRSRERTQLDALIRQTQARVAPLGVGTATAGARGSRKNPRAARVFAAFPSGEVRLLWRRHNRLQRQVAELRGTLQNRDEQLSILQDLVAVLQGELASRPAKAVR